MLYPVYYFLVSFLDFTCLINNIQHHLFVHLCWIRDLTVQQVSQDLMRQCLFGKAGGTSRIVRKDLFLTGSDTNIDLGPIGIGVRGRQVLGFHIGNGIVSKLFEVENFLQIRQNCHEVMSMRIPTGVGRFHIQNTRHGIDMRIVHVG